MSYLQSVSGLLREFESPCHQPTIALSGAPVGIRLRVCFPRRNIIEPLGSSAGSHNVMPGGISLLSEAIST